MWRNHSRKTWAELLEDCDNYHNKASWRHFIATGKINPDIPLRILLRISSNAPKNHIYTNMLWDRVKELQEEELKKTQPESGE